MSNCVSGRACFKKNSSLHICPKNFWTTFLGYYPKILYFISQKFWWPFSLVISFFTLFYPSQCPSFLFLNSTFSRQKFLDDLLIAFYPKILHFISNKFLWLFWVIDLFNVFYPFVFYRWWLLFPIVTPIDPFYTHSHAVFHVSTPCFVLSKQ